jgi:hypothetical protein
MKDGIDSIVFWSLANAITGKKKTRGIRRENKGKDKHYY